MQDFDFENKIVYLRNTKGKRIDAIPMLSDIESFVSKLDADGNLFNYNSRHSLKFWVRANKRSGFKNSFHSLRKARGTDLANSGVEPLFLKTFMRHEDIRTTLKYYVKLDIDNMRQKINEKL